MKNHVQGRERVLAVCDAELVGRSFKQGPLRLTVSADFYDGFAGGADELERHLRSCTVANLVGQRSVDAAVELGFVSRDNVLVIDGIPHAQWALLL